MRDAGSLMGRGPRAGQMRERKLHQDFQYIQAMVAAKCSAAIIRKANR